MKIKTILASLALALAMVIAPLTASAADPLDVMALGDSITRGQGDGGTTGTYNGWRCSFKNRLASGGVQINYVGPLSEGSSSCTDREHAGWSGWTIGELTIRAAEWMTAYQPDVVLLMAGTNDIIEKVDLPNIANRLGLLIDTIKAARPGVQVIVSTIPQIGTSKWCCNAEQVAAWNSYRGALPGRAMLHGAASVAYQDRITKPMLNADAIHPKACAYGSLMPFNWYFAWFQARPRPTADPLWPPVGCPV